jgi:uncharacterized protein (DUF3084 family)
MLTFGIKIILLLLIIGGIIAYLGDYLGTFIGRKRLTIFNLRPRHTAYAITVLTGILIVFTTMGVILAVSQDARTALFGLEEMRKEISEKSKLLEETKGELELRIAEKEQIDEDLKNTQKKLDQLRNNLSKARKEIQALEKTKDKLSKQVEVSRKGKVLFKVGEVLLTSVIYAGPEKEKLEAGLKQILSAADVYVRSFGVEQPKHLIFITPEDFAQAVAALKERRGENIVMVIVDRNTLFGETVPVHFAVSENKVIYQAQEVIAESLIDESLSIPEIEQEIKQLLTVTHQKAKNAGIIPDETGSIGSVPYAKIFSLAKKIKTYKKGVRLKAIAKEKTTRLGPLELDFKVFYQ